MVVAGTIGILAVGSGAISDTQGALDADRSQKVLTQIDSQAAMVGLGNSRVQRVALSNSRDGGYSVDGDAGWMNVTVDNVSAGSRESVMNATLGTIEYSDDYRTVAYQGGGVWTEQSNGSVMIAPPEFYYRDATLTLPLVTVDGDRSLDGAVTISRDGSPTPHFPNASLSENFTNPLKNGRVNVTVQSRFYQAWGRYFEQRTDGEARYDHQRETVTVTLVVPAGPQTVESAMAATSAGGEIAMSGSGGDPSRTDSYNSSNGSYSATQTEEGNISTAGDVSVKGNSEVFGSIRSGGFVEVKGSGYVSGDVYYADGHTTHSGTVDGTVEQIDEVSGTGGVDTHVAAEYDAIADANNNTDAADVSGDALDGGDVTLGPGDYHLNEIALDAEELTFDTTDDGKTIRVAVRDFVSIDDGGRIEVEGTGQVQFYYDTQDTTASGHHFEITNDGGVVDVENDERSSQLWMYGPSDFQATVDGSNGATQRFEGVIYAPAGEGGGSNFHIDKGDLYGGVVTGTVEMDNGGAIHYDRALHGRRVIPDDQNVVRLTYLHVSHNPIRVESS